MSGLITSDKEIRTMCIDGVVGELIQRYALSHIGADVFLAEAKEVMKDVPTTVLREMIGSVIKSYGYGQKQTTILKEIEYYNSLHRTKTGEIE